MGRISRLLLLLAAAVVLVIATGVAAQEEAAEAVVEVEEGIVERAKEEAEAVALRAELQQLRDKISGLGKCRGVPCWCISSG